MTVLCFKMMNGDDVLAKVISDCTNSIVVENPAAIVIQRGQDGKMAVGLSPYSPFAENGQMTLFKSGMAGQCNVDVNLQNEWNRLFGSGIQIAPADALVGLK